MSRKIDCEELWAGMSGGRAAAAAVDRGLRVLIFAVICSRASHAAVPSRSQPEWTAASRRSPPSRRDLVGRVFSSLAASAPPHSAAAATGRAQRRVPGPGFSMMRAQRACRCFCLIVRVIGSIITFHRRREAARRTPRSGAPTFATSRRLQGTASFGRRRMLIEHGGDPAHQGEAQTSTASSTASDRPSRRPPAPQRVAPVGDRPGVERPPEGGPALTHRGPLPANAAERDRRPAGR